MFKFHKKKYIKIEEPEFTPIPTSPYLKYSRYENIIVDNNFKYTNEELTGETSYDIYLLYIKRDDHKVKYYLDEPVDENIMRIKNNPDIKLIKNDNGYEISNGRHRLVYLKSVYALESLNNPNVNKDKYTITVQIEYTLDKKYEEEFKTLIEIYPQMKFYKVNPYDDNPVIFIYNEKKTYLINNYNELLEFKHNKEKYLYIERTNKIYYDYDELIKLIYSKLGIKLFELSIIDIINYLTINKIVAKESINLPKLYNSYIILQDYINRYKLKNITLIDINLDQILFSKMYRLGLELNTIIKTHPESDNILKLIKKYPEYKDYSEEYILKSLKSIK